jgi:pimeloyl-ACP methyl ester carboxylesterase
MKKYLLSLLALTSAGCQPAVSENLYVNGVSLNYIVRGDGPPLYLLHGGMESRESFEIQIPVFAKNFTVVALDSREQGRSGSSEEQISYELMSNDVLALAQHLGHERISIVGLSDGGITGLTIAIRRPDAIDKLVLLGATFHFDSYPSDVRDFISNYEWDGNTDPTKFPGNFIKHYLSGHNNLDDFGRLLKEMATMWTTSPAYTRSDLQKIEANTLVINGDREDTILEHALELYAGITNSQLFVVPGGTHYSLQEKPELVNHVIMKFLTDENE